jgi:hypothetical protein
MEKETGCVNSNDNDTDTNGVETDDELYAVEEKESEKEEEIWRDVPIELTANVDLDIQVSNLGNVRHKTTLNKKNKLGNFTRNSEGSYPYLQELGTIFYVHRLVYGAFNLDILDDVINGTVKYKKNAEKDENDVFLAKLKDLVLRKKTYTKLSNAVSIDSPSQKGNHPKYGEFYYFKPYLVKAHSYDRTKKESCITDYDYSLILTLDKKLPCKIFNNRNKKEIRIGYSKEYDPVVSFSKTGCKSKNYLLTHVMLATVFPDIPTKYTVDHVSEEDDSTDHSIINLQWMTMSENSKKAQEKALKNKNKMGKKIVAIDKKNNEITHNFISIVEATKFIMDNGRSKGNSNTTCGKIRAAVDKPKLSAYGYIWKSQEYYTIGGEEWKTINFEDGYSAEVSNKGRYKNSYGVISRGGLIRGRKYRRVGVVIKTNISQKFYIHQLVWMAFVGALPEDGKVILHDDNAPLDEEGAYRNWLCDLRIGTKSENMEEHFSSLIDKLTNEQSMD